jgi:hypothetical protein
MAPRPPLHLKWGLIAYNNPSISKEAVDFGRVSPLIIYLPVGILTFRHSDLTHSRLWRERRNFAAGEKSKAEGYGTRQSEGEAAESWNGAFC